MNRLIVQFGAVPKDTDILYTNKHAMVGLGMALEALLGAGNTGPYVDGLPCVAGTGLTVNVGAGSIYVQAAIDSTAYASLPADTTDLIIQQGITFGQTSFSCPAPSTSGQSINYLIQAQFQQVDAIPVAQLYYNSANPLQPLTGTATNTVREGVCALEIKAGTAAATGSQVTPTADSGWTALYVVTVAYGTTQIASGNIATVSGAPILAGLLNSHHGGVAGQAPKINLASEVQGTLPLANLPTIPSSLLPIGLTFWCGTSTGTANAQSITTPAAILSFPTGSGIAFKVGSGLTNTGAVTLTVGSFGTFAVLKDGPTGPIALTGGEMVAGETMTARFDGTNLQLTSTELGTAALANASSSTGTVSAVTGSGSITAGHIAVFTDSNGSVGDGGPAGVAAAPAILGVANNGNVIGPGVYLIDTSGGAFGINLLASAAYGASWTFIDGPGAWRQNNFTINLGSYTVTPSNLPVQSGSVICNVSGEEFVLWNAGSTLKLI